MLKNTERLFLSAESLKTCRSLLILFVFIFSANAHAQRLSGHFLISTPKLKQTLENLIVQKKPIVGTYADSIHLPSTIPIAVEKVEYKLDWKQSTIAPIIDNKIRFSLIQPQLEVLVPQLNIDTYIIKEINGAILKVHVKSNCENIKLTATSDTIDLLADMTGAGNVNSVDVKTSINSIDIGSPKLSVKDFLCDNVTGLEDVVADEMLQQFSKVDFFKPMLLDKMNAVLVEDIRVYTAKVEKIIRNQVQDNDDLQSLQFNLLQINENFLDIAFSTGEPANTVVELENYKIPTDAVLVVDKNLLQDYLRKNLNSKFSKTSYSSKTIAELDKLTQSRFKQFFVWPALMKRPKGKALILRPALETLVLSIKPNTDVKNLVTNVVAGIWVMDGTESMVYLRSKIQAQSSLAPDKVQTVINSLKTTPSWDESYVKKHDCSKRISTSIVDTVAQKYFTDNWANVNLSAMQLVDGKTVKLKNVFLSSDEKLYFNLNLDNLKTSP